jgi:pSer/pThr/pTyr-binding forkhead associated (FHA) protein
MENTNRFLMVVRRGPGVGQSFELDSALASIGRYAGNTIVIPDETVSRHHARLRRVEDGYSVEDLNSANGLFVNGKRVAETRALVSGDVIRLGELVELVYKVISEAELRARAASVIPAFDDQPSSQPVSDTGGTVWMKAVSSVGRDEQEPARREGRPWLWIVIAAGVMVLAAIGYFGFIAGH